MDLGPTVQYTRSELSEISQTVTKDYRLPKDVYSRLTYHNITAIPATRRGCRGGTNRPIPARMSDNSTYRPSSDTQAFYKGHVRYVNYANLVSITASPNLTQQQSTVQHIDFGFLNAQSVNTKTSKIREHVTDHNLDILGITETWKPTNTKIVELKPNGFSFPHYPRRHKRWRSWDITQRQSGPKT